MADIFVSYARPDKDRVAPLIAAFKAQGWSVWWDPAMAPGQEFDRQISAELDAAKAVVVVWTPQSVDSRWVRGEARLAADRNILVPVRFENARLPIDALALHTTDLDDWRGNPQSAPFQDLLRALKPLVGASSSAVAAPTPAAGGGTGSPSLLPKLKPWQIGAATALVLAAIALAVFGLPDSTAKNNAPKTSTQQHSKEASIAGGALVEKVAEISKLVQKDRYGAAFPLAQQIVASGAAKNSPGIQDLWHQINLPIKPLVSEDGATVYFKTYEDADGPWVKAGITPFTKAVDAPRGVLRIKVEKPGFVTGYFVIHNPGPSVDNDPPDPPIAAVSFAKVALPLAADGTIPDDMVLVPHTNIPATLSGWSTPLIGNRQDIPAFAMSKYEVTNQQFKEFIDAGGYDNPTYWEGLKFEDGGHEMPWAAARKKFVDKTNRPGPAGWQLSTYPAGQANMPVGGISWYEAVAYARFRGQTLPTIHHWVRAAFAPNEPWFNTAPTVALASRFSANGPIPATSETGIGPWGTFNMAGNVREWVWNFAGDRGIALGGDWEDYATLFQQVYPTSPMERSPMNGMRLMHVLSGTEVKDDLLKPIALVLDSPDLARKPVSDEAFRAMRYQFTTSHAKPVKTSVQQIKQTPLWIAEEVVLKYTGGDITTIYVIKPKTHHNPLQPIIYGPPGDCCFGKRPNRNALEQMRPPADTIVDSGRALVIPIWAESYERAATQSQYLSLGTDEDYDRYRRAALAWFQDISNTLDYLETRPDIDMQRAGYMGFSYGAGLEGPIALATEGRLKAAVLISGGISPTSPHPMADAINYVPRIKVPVLMINGRYDHIYPYEQSQKRMFDLLGTPASEKKHIVYDVGHFAFPSNSIVLDISNWFDKYLGPVN